MAMIIRISFSPQDFRADFPADRKIKFDVLEFEWFDFLGQVYGRKTKPHMAKIHKKIGCGYRCAIWLRQAYGYNRGKSIARDFGVSENTAWLWMSGKCPSVWHLEAMVARWGRHFIEYVFSDAEEPTEAIETILKIRAELARRDAAEEEERKSSGDSGTGRFFLANDFPPYEWYEDRLDCSSSEALSRTDRHRLFFELWFGYRDLISSSYGRKFSSWRETLWVNLKARLRLTQLDMFLNGL